MRLENESGFSEVWCDLRDLGNRKEIEGFTWQDIADVLNVKYSLDLSESWYRKKYKWMWKNEIDSATQLAQHLGRSEDTSNNYVENDQSYAQYIQEQTEEADRKYTDFINEQLLEIQKEKIKARDERTQINAILRRLSREETIREIAKEAVAKCNLTRPLPRYEKKEEFHDYPIYEGILMLSDWHYGINIDLYENKFNTDICEKRIAKLLCITKELVQKNDIKTLHVVNLSDLIAGRMHLPLRVNSQVDTITQILRVSEILADFLNELSAIVKVEFYNCLDNHSRIEPNKKESLDLESLARIVPWFIKERLSFNENVNVNKNMYGEDIITFMCNGHCVIGVHGDNDKPTDVVTNLTLLTNNIYDLMLTAHRHHFSCDEENQTIIVSNGTLMGCDEYSHKLRKSSKPSQNFIVVSDDNPIEAIYRILL